MRLGGDSAERMCGWGGNCYVKFGGDGITFVRRWEFEIDDMDIWIHRAEEGDGVTFLGGLYIFTF